MKNSKLYFYLLFYALLIVSIIPILLNRFVPSLDAPQHLNTINMLVEIIKGNDFVREYFTINSLPVGYWGAHFIIGLFRLFLPMFLAEKMYLIIYVMGMAFSFKYLIQSIKPGLNSYSSLIIFPFIFSFYQLLGYYTFCLAAILYFTTLGYWLRHKEGLNLRYVFILAGLLILLFFSHALVYVFGLISFFVFFIGKIINDISARNKPFDFKYWQRITSRFILAVLPSFILLLWYLNSVIEVDGTISGFDHNITDQLKEFFTIRLLIGFHIEKERIATIPLAILLFSLIIFQIIKFAKEKNIKTLLYRITLTENLFFFISLVFLSFYFLAPNKISAGSLVNRYGLFFFFNIITWLSIKPTSKYLNLLIGVILIFFTIYTQLFYNKVYKDMNEDIAELKELEQHMEPNSLIHSTSNSDNWLHSHFALYIGTDRPLVNVRNPQCWGQFPVVWKFDKMPLVSFGDTSIIFPPDNYRINAEGRKRQVIEYEVIFNYHLIWNNPEYIERQTLLNISYDSVYSSSNSNAVLFRYKAHEEVY